MPDLFNPTREDFLFFKKRFPDYIGNWAYHPIMTIPEGFFVMYIEKRKVMQAGEESIEGTIDDRFGSASFEGVLTPQDIKFKKLYFPEAVQKGAAPFGVKYHGQKEGSAYIGDYTAIQVKTPDGITCDRKDRFIMKKFIDIDWCPKYNPEGDSLFSSTISIFPPPGITFSDK